MNTAYWNTSLEIPFLWIYFRRIEVKNQVILPETSIEPGKCLFNQQQQPFYQVLSLPPHVTRAGSTAMHGRGWETVSNFTFINIAGNLHRSWPVSVIGQWLPQRADTELWHRDRTTKFCLYRLKNVSERCQKGPSSKNRNVSCEEDHHEASNEKEPCAITNWNEFVNKVQPQWDNCQGIGHAAVICTMPYTCLKYANSRIPGKCLEFRRRRNPPVLIVVRLKVWLIIINVQP